MKVRELIRLDVDIDVANTVTDDLWPAFVGPQKLTPDGEADFADVLDFDVYLDKDYGMATVDVDAPGDEWKTKYIHARKFFCAMAGYCAEAEYDKWFAAD